MTWTDKQLNDAEEAVTKLTEATGLTDKEIVEVIADGFAMKYNAIFISSKGKLPDNIRELIDELRATFDAY